ncbi:uncharacterized protein FOMMEDRAFT_97153, partial [Fomitiporia mediterranea MF3/22]|uniref:uncharacterized protein n=1 Tax=Fomitiporia mediterranea (strain MF3/22) TaxID=694068 RepID=UPI0004409A6C
VPPYYMFAWKVNGVPTVSPLGSDLSSLSWKVNHASDNGSGSSCLPPTPSTTITISPNVSTSDSVDTCEPLGLSMTGGKKPYTVSIAGMNTVLVSNVTLNDGDDVLTWPNRVNPNNQFIGMPPGMCIYSN